MKETLLSTLKLPNKDELIQQLIHSGYAFACWRKPNEVSQLIISLDEPTRLEHFLFASLEPGFLVNSFDDSHPTSPTYLKADIVVKAEDLAIHPRVSDKELDALRSALLDNNTQVSANASKAELGIDFDENDFKQQVVKAVEEIKNDRFEKVVLSRCMIEESAKDFQFWSCFNQISEAYPNAFVSLIHLPGQGVWVGASPELLLSQNQERFRTVALAGTKKLQPNQKLSEIAWTQKEIEEQAFVSRYIINCFKKLRLREFHEQGPKTVKAGHLAHLKTSFEVKYDEVAFDDLAEQMLRLMHPTSAVCGMPIEEAKPWLADHEHYDRELYAGFLGPVNYENSTDLYVNLRCAKFEGSFVTYYAGAGITEDSNPDSEFEETEIKINVLRNIINRI